MLNSSVGNKGVNTQDDVKTVQQIINLRDDLRTPLPRLVVDGKLGTQTQSAIVQIQSKLIQTPNGLIEPMVQQLIKCGP